MYIVQVLDRVTRTYPDKQVIQITWLGEQGLRLYTSFDIRSPSAEGKTLMARADADGVAMRLETY